MARPRMPPAPVTPLDADRQEQQKVVAEQTLERIHQLRGQTRDRAGKIKRAKLKAAVLACRWEGFNPQETSEILGVTLGVVRSALMSLRKGAEMDQQISKLDELIVPLAVDNIATMVMRGDKDATFKVLDGRGVFRTHKSIDAQVTRRTLSLRIDMTVPAHLAGQPLPQAKLGAIHGAVSKEAQEVIDGQLVNDAPIDRTGVIESL